MSSLALLSCTRDDASPAFRGDQWSLQWAIGTNNMVTWQNAGLLKRAAGAEKVVDPITSCFVLETDWTAWGAIGSLAAAAVALLVAGFSEVRRKTEAEAKAKVIAQIVLEDLRARYVNVTAGRILLETKPKFPSDEVGLRRNAIGLLKSLDHGSLPELVPYSRVLSARTCEDLAKCYSQIGGIRLRQELIEAGVEKNATDSSQLQPIFIDVAVSLKALIESLRDWIGSKENEDLETRADDRAEKTMKRVETERLLAEMRKLSGQDE
ncbi:hypothetical protein [Stenotrophomonas muris]|uniref:hypothetical protein n=1 Tax=Stenotrophomonas muris TaxID=2963283 RepID=UPI0040554211